MGASILDPGVLTLELAKPPGFSYIPGQYVLMQCGDISSYEWHPFTLTSAPDDNFLQVHISNAGDWTGALHARFCATMQLTRSDKGALMQSLTESSEQPESPSSAPGTTSPFCNGPEVGSGQVHAAGAQTSKVPKQAVAEMTDLISQNIVSHRPQARVSLSSERVSSEYVITVAESPDTADGKADNVEQRKAYMHWVVRDPRAAGWLKYEFEIASLLDVSGDVFKSHIHVTGKHHAQEVTSSNFWAPDPQLPSNVELTNGRPDFETILKGIQADVGRARVGVFLCGPLPVREHLRKLCAELTKAGDTTFVFHAERF
ncbi:hypothetical protein WJX75_002422 [Coccomyxa subellipsoidea]|uniref:FAD-binding FR-type domain-containing protein n=1 Tax=Coccomyxa subellipsoidea TaxID=248742 RepID=A0ABR2YAS8_9CHLO